MFIAYNKVLSECARSLIPTHTGMGLYNNGIVVKTNL